MAAVKSVGVVQCLAVIAAPRHQPGMICLHSVPALCRLLRPRRMLVHPEINFCSVGPAIAPLHLSNLLMHNQDRCTHA
jgi:hypothetical protein